MDFNKQITVVVCGGKQEFIDYCRENSLKPDDLFLRYAGTKRHLEGLRNCKVIYYKNYWNNSLFGSSILDEITK